MTKFAISGVILSSTLLLLVGCGGSKSSSSSSTPAGVGSTTGPVTSGSGGTTTDPLAFRALDRGDVTGLAAASSATTTTFEVIDDQRFPTFWQDHQSGGQPAVALPTVDFASERVVAVYLGQRPTSGHGIEVVSVAEVNSSIEVSYVTREPQTALPQQTTTPFDIVAINRTQLPFVLVDVTTPPGPVQLSDVHGVLVNVPAGGQKTLAFLEDGADKPWEIDDFAALQAKDARLGSTLILSGEREPNAAGQTALAQRVKITTFTVDEVAAHGRLEANAVPNGGIVLRTDANVLYELKGPAAQTMQTNGPVFVSGTLDPNHVSSSGREGLIVSAWHETTEVGYGLRGGFPGIDQEFRVKDLHRTGYYGYHSRPLYPNNNFPFFTTRTGEGRLDASARADLERLVAAADLRNQPSVFYGPPIMDAPNTILTVRDKNGEVKVTILIGATLPPEVDALVKALRAMRDAAPSFRSLSLGPGCQITQASTRVARDDLAFQSLWSGAYGMVSPPTPPVDMSQEVVVGVFLGWVGALNAIEVTSIVRLGDDIVVNLKRSRPRPGQVVTLNLISPHHTVSITGKGLKGDLYIGDDTASID